MNIFRFKKIRVLSAILIPACLAGLLWFAFSLPNPLFDLPYSQVMYDRRIGFLNVHAAEDEQWRFLPKREVNPKFAVALYYEDKRFMHHAGLDPIAVAGRRFRTLRPGGLF